MRALRAAGGNEVELREMYGDFREFVVRSGYEGELDWQGSLEFEAITEVDFLRETAWVVLSAGFKESIVRSIFPALSEAFLDWGSAREIVEAKALCRQEALAVFASTAKIDAIIAIAQTVDRVGFGVVKAHIRDGQTEYLQQFPFIGPVTRFHLGKNLGLNVVKPDRHLVRLARVTGHDSPHELCSRIARATGEPVAVVDTVLWRYATLRRDYEEEAREYLG